MKVLILILLAFIQADHAQEEEKSVPCQPDWYFFDGNCYKLARNETGLLKLNWKDAVAKCRKYDGQLVTIHSEALQRFIGANLLLNAKKSTWIAFYRPDGEHAFEWDDESPVDYTNWGQYEPHIHYGVEGEDCVKMRYGRIKVLGKWYNSHCNVSLPFVCQKEQDLKLSSPDLRYCPDALGGGWSFRDSCFNIVNEEKNWQEAEEHCVQHYDGHLVTVPDVPTRFFLDSILDENYDGDYWVGIHIENLKKRQGILKWNSGRYVDVGLVSIFWNDYISNCFESVPKLKSLCVSISEEKPWKLETCEKLKPFFCEHSLKKTSISKNRKKVSELNCPIASGNIEDWVDLGGEQCYYFSKKALDSWDIANFECMQRGGFLASIHSQEELENLKQFFSYYEPDVHIGLFRTQTYVDHFRWADGSEVDFQAWNEGEPHNTTWKTECVVMKTSSMKWETIGCIMDVKYSICSIKKKVQVQIEENSTYITYSENESKTVPCLPDWYYIDEKCYKVGRDDKGLLEVKWDEAAGKCVEYGGHLVSIHNREFQEDFIKSFLYEIKKNTWIGLRRTSGEDSFTWHDGSPVAYTNWDRNNKSPIPGKQKDCVETLYPSSIYRDSKWNNVDCRNKKPFVCQMEQDPNLSSPDVRYCPQALGGGRRFRDSCLHLENKEKNWDDAEKHCAEHYNGHLVTITDEFMRGFVNYITGSKSRSEYWIGIHLQNGLLQKWSSGRYVDLDVKATIFYLRDWNKNNDNSFYDVSDFCVMLNDRGYWGVDKCTTQKNFICQVSLPRIFPSISPLKLSGYACPGNFDDWLDLGGDKCYYISRNHAFSWHDANHECLKRGSYLTSIHSQQELNTLVQFFSYSGGGYCIGLFKSLNYGQFLWVDGSKVDFEAWEMGEPNNPSEECVELSGSTSKWNDIPCDKMKKFICSIPKTPSNAD